MGSSDAEFLDMLKYFHEDKGDITRYCYFDEDRFRRLDSSAHFAWKNYLVAQKMLDILMGSLGD